MEMSTEEMLWAGLQAGPVHVLQNTAEGGKRVRPSASVKPPQRDECTSTLGPGSTRSVSQRFSFTINALEFPSLSHPHSPEISQLPNPLIK